MLDLATFTGWLGVTFIAAQLLYLLSFAFDGYLYTLPINWVDATGPGDRRDLPQGREEETPFIVLFYPVLRELEETMRTTLGAIGRMDYPASRYQVLAIPNESDGETVARLRKLQAEFPFLQVLEVPSTTDPSWRVVWDNWDQNPKAYWWWEGRYSRRRDLPPKKTRQLIYAFYTVSKTRESQGDFLISYIDADSCPPHDHFRAAARGMQQYDVLQAQNVAGNLNSSLAASWHAMDHMVWDGGKYAHMSADGRQPYWVLGKGLFFRASDLWRLGGFHPWIAIEDPEVGMRCWSAGLKLGVIEKPLIEEVPETFGHGITQRKRWVCGFFQSLTEPLKRLEFTPAQKLKAWLNFLPCLSLLVNLVGVPTGAWALWSLIRHENPLPAWTWWLAAANLALLCVSLVRLYTVAWQRTALVLSRRRDRLAYMLRINPLSVLVWWCVWVVPILMGLWMFLRDGGLVWERTEKVNANEALVTQLGDHRGLARSQSLK